MQNSIQNKFTIQESFSISAGAGSGKTYTLSRRYINAILGFDFFVENSAQLNHIESKEKNCAEIEQIVTITYTTAAALEMKERIFTLMENIILYIEGSLAEDDGDYSSIMMGIEKLRDEEDRRYIVQTLQRALQNSNSAMIMTIHAFCLTIIQKNSDIAKVDSNLSIIDDMQKEEIIKEVALETKTQNKEEIFELLSIMDSSRFNSLASKYLTNSKFRVTFDKFAKTPLSIDTYKSIIRALYPLPEITQDILDEINNASDSEIREKWFNEYVENFESFQALPWGHFEIKTTKKSGKNAGNEEMKALGLGPKTYLSLDPFVRAMEKNVSNYSNIDEEKEHDFSNLVKKIQSLLEKMYQNYLKKLLENNQLDFDAILTKTAQIIKEVEDDFKYIMVDEFQDTNSLQIGIINTISTDKGRNLFKVGDSKQSIYAFQGAELEVFNKEVGVDAVSMSVNRRSDRVILDFVNSVFFYLFESAQENLIEENYKATFKDEDKLSHPEKENKAGKVEFLISVDDKKEEAVKQQWKNIAKFVKAIKENKIDGYDEIKKKLNKNEKAIGIVFDAKTKMLELKKELNSLGIECKVSASDAFYQTKEVSDLFLVLKATEILKRKAYQIDSSDSEDEVKLYAKDKFYIAGALRSNILRYDESQIVELLNSDITQIINIFQKNIEAMQELQLSQFIKYIVDEYRLLDIYNYLGDIEQKSANIEKLIQSAIEYETNNSSDLYDYLKELEEYIYFIKNLKEDEAFYKSDSVESVELCTIHSTKGLDYPMIILAQSEKDVVTKSAQDYGLNFNTFAIKEGKEYEEYGAVGFKLGEYSPLSYRVLNQINKNKSEAERKRLLYVALTRAKHNIVISGSIALSSKKPSLNENSYLAWLAKSCGVTTNELYNETENENITFIDKDKFSDIVGDKISPNSYEVVQLDEKKIDFKESKKDIASDNENHTMYENSAKQAIIGTKIHSILERYWNKLEDDAIVEKIYLKYSIYDEKAKDKVKRYIENFKQTTTYKELKGGAEHHFEMEFNSFKENKHKQGIIDLIYFNKDKNGWVIVDFKSNSVEKVKDLTAFVQENGYDKQLESYQMLCKDKEMAVTSKLLLFLDSGIEEIV